MVIDESLAVIYVKLSTSPFAFKNPVVNPSVFVILSAIIPPTPLKLVVFAIFAVWYCVLVSTAEILVSTSNEFVKNANSKSWLFENDVKPSPAPCLNITGIVTCESTVIVGGAVILYWM